MRRAACQLALVSASWLALAAAAEAQAIFDGDFDSDWTVPENWTGDVLPGPGSTAVINGTSTRPASITGGDSVTVRQTDVSAGNLGLGLPVFGSGTLTSALSVSGTGRVIIDQSSALNGDVTQTGGRLDNFGTINGTLTISNGTMNNSALVTGEVTLTGGVLNLTGASDLADAQALTIGGGVVNLGLSDTIGSLTVRGGALAGGILNASADATLTVGDMSLGGQRITAQTGRTLTLVSTGNFSAPQLVTIGSTDSQGTVVLTPLGTTETTATSSLFIERGTLVLGNENALRPFSDGELTRIGTAATLDLSGFSTTLRRLTGDGTITSSRPGSVVLTLSEDVARAFNGVIEDGSGNVAVTKTGPGRTTLSGTNTYSGLTTVSAGTLEVSNGAGLGASGAGSGTTVAAGATLALSGVAPGGITTNEAITLNGAGVSNGGALRNLSGFNTVTGAITLGSVTRINSDANRLFLEGDITGNQDLTLGGAGEMYIDGNIETGSGSVTIDNTGYVRFGGINTFTGALAVNAGVLELGSGSDLADSVPVQVASGARLRLQRSATLGNLSGAGIIQFNNSGITLTLGDATDSTFSGTLDGSSNIGSLTKQGTGTLTLSGSNTIEGTTTINAGTLRVTGGAAIADGGAVSVGAAGTLDVAQSEAIRALEGAGSVTIAAGRLLTTVGNDSTTFSGVISGAGGLFKLGNGTLTLSGANTYTGRTIVDAGTLDVTGSVGSDVVVIEGSGRVIAHGNSISDGARVELATPMATLDLRGDETIGALRFGGFAPIAGIVELGANTLTLAGTGSDYFGAINGTGSLVVTSGDHSIRQTSGLFTGDVAVTGGTLAGAFLRAAGLTISGTGTFENPRDQRVATVTQTGGTLTGGRILSVTFDYALSGGTVTTSGTPSLVVNTGTFTMSGGTIAAGVTIESASTSTLSGGSIAGTLTGIGVTRVTGPVDLTGTITLPVTVAVGGTLNLNTGSDLTGELTVDSGGTVNVNESDAVASLAGAGSVTIAAGQLLTTGGGDTDTTFSGVISGAGGLEKQGIGTLTLSGVNPYTGRTNVREGTLNVTGSIASTILEVSSGGNLQVDGQSLDDAARVSLVNDGIITLTGSETIGTLNTIAGNTSTVNLNAFTLTLSTGTGLYEGGISGSGGVTVTGGAHILGGSNTFTGALTVTGGSVSTIRATASTATVSGGSLIGGLSGSTILTITGTGTFDNVANQTIASVSQTGGTLTGNRTLTITGDYTLSGGQVTSGAPVTAATFTLSGGTIAAGATVNSAGLKTLSAGTIAGTLGGTGIARIISDAVTITTTGTIAGDVEVAAGGTLRISHSDAVSGTITTTGSVISYADGVDEASPVVLNSNTTQFEVAAGVATQTGVISETGGARPFEKIGDGSLKLSGANTFTGATTVSAGSLDIGGSIASEVVNVNGGLLRAFGTALSDTADVTLSGTGQLELRGSETIGSLASASADSGVELLNHTLTTGGNDASTTFAGVISRSGRLVKQGAGTFTLTGANTYTGTTTINAGALRIGDGGRTGTLGTGSVINNGALIFDRSDDITLANLVSGTGSLTQQGTGSLTLSGANSFTGAATVSAGTLILTTGAALADTAPVIIAAGATLRVDQSETIGALTNLGTVDLSAGNGTADTVLTVTGGYTAGSALRIDTMLGDDSAMADRVVIAGDTSGATEVFVNVLGGTGAPTASGILIVDVAGASDGTFVLANADTTLPGGQAALTAPGGEFLYALRQNGGDWVLQSQLQPAAVAFEVYPSALLGLTQAGTLSQRLGARQMLTRGAPATEGGRLSTRGQAATPQTGAWLSVSATRLDVTPQASSAAVSYDQTIRMVEAGLEMVLAEATGGTLVGGISLATGDGDVTSTSVIGAGRIDTDAQGIDLTATWYGFDGFYADLQLGYRDFDSDLFSATAGVLATGVGGTGRFASIEIGRSFAAEPGLTLTPQAQLSWAKVRMDGFVAPGPVAVAGRDAESLRLRLGLAAERSWQTSGGAAARLTAVGNLIHENSDTTVLFGTTPIGSSAPDWSAEIGIGGSLTWTDGKRRTALFGELTAARGLGGGDLSGLSGTFGLRLTW